MGEDPTTSPLTYLTALLLLSNDEICFVWPHYSQCAGMACDCPGRVGPLNMGDPHVHLGLHFSGYPL